jgi:hypothetical protein
MPFDGGLRQRNLVSEEGKSKQEGKATESTQAMIEGIEEEIYNGKFDLSTSLRWKLPLGQYLVCEVVPAKFRVETAYKIYCTWDMKASIFQ